MRREKKLTASDGAANDYFGSSVAMSGDGTKVIVGAYRKQVGANAKQGAAYVYSGANYATEQRLTASDGAANDTFGNAVAMSSDGTHVIVGAAGKQTRCQYQSGRGIYLRHPRAAEPVAEPAAGRATAGGGARAPAATASTVPVSGGYTAATAHPRRPESRDACLPEREARHAPTIPRLSQSSRRAVRPAPCGDTDILLPALAVQAAPMTYTVSNTNDTNSGSLRQAVTDANANDPGSGARNTILFTIPGGSTITLASQLTLTRAVLIQGPTGGITVSGGGSTRVFVVNSGVTAEFAALRITNGKAANGANGAMAPSVAPPPPVAMVAMAAMAATAAASSIRVR